MEDLSDLKVGDRVIQRYSSWTGIVESVKTIEKITPTGLIRVDGYLFRKNGSCRGDGNLSIRRWSQEEEDKINRIRLEKKTKRTCINVFTERMNKLTYEQAVAILKILKGE